jgi:hypothetical protein
MAKQKKEKIQEIYQLVNCDNKPVKFESTWSKSHVSTVKAGKLYKTKASALNTVRRAIKEAKDASSYYASQKTFESFGAVVNKEEWIESLLKLKIQVFHPVLTEDLTFHLDKLK